MDVKKTERGTKKFDPKQSGSQFHVTITDYDR